MTKSFLLFFVLILFVSCSKDVEKKSVIEQKSLDLQIREAYSEGLDALEQGDVLFAARKFNEVEILYPQSDFAPKSSLMAAYSYYIQDYYEDCIMELDRFLKIYPKNKNLDYAYYMLGVAYYEQIVDEKKDTFSILKAKDYFEYLIKNYPNTEYAFDAAFKIELIEDILAAKELYVGRYYVDRKKWIPAINRFKNVVNDYDTTIYVEEALYRLVEIYYLLGLKEESKKYAALLGYNYQSSQWYENSFALFDESYEKIKRNEKNSKNNLRKKIKTLFSIDE
ncbi:outer membrane protein assembly factor BamD [Candidatus Pelagibacter sp. HIMB1587]|uniref:outer membrane protein assembly factor BamD n=1 Tax=Candidatus Pelagibacter sp. HIMB1587 TaxID=3413354 RepID=UPI003F855474